MKTKFYVLIFLLAAACARAQTSNLTSLLQQGLFEEQANRNLDAAISNYQSLAAQFDKDRQLAATAVFRIGECYRMQGKTNEAVGQYQRILRDFSDQTALATLSRQNLAGLGSAATLTSAAQPLSDAARTEQEKLLQQEIQLFQQQLESQQKQVKLGVLPPDGLLPTQQKLLELKMQLAAFQPGSPQPVAVTDEEEHEIRRIQQMIQDSPDLINAVKPGDVLPLVNAARNGQIKVATYLLDHGAEINGGQGWTALHEAANVGNRAVVELLLSRGANVNAKSDNAQNHSGIAGTPLSVAAKKGFQAVVEVLLAHKADVNVSAAYTGETPLHLAAGQGRTKIVQMLLNAGANPNLENSNGHTPLSLAANSGSPETVKLLLDAKAGANGGRTDAPLLMAIRERDAASAELLLKAGANPNLKGAIDWSISFGNGSYPNGTSITPIFLAVLTKQSSMVDLLLKFKADANDSQTVGGSLLYTALSETNILESLLNAGAKVDESKSQSESTPLVAAAFGNNAAAVEILLKHGANPNLRQANYFLPLDAAARAVADAKVFELLLAYKADPNVRGYENKTPLEVLKDKMHQGGPDSVEKRTAKNLADLLRQHGALDNLPNWDSITVSRPSSGFSSEVFRKGTNDWNRFTLLETILNYYSSSKLPSPGLGANFGVNSAAYRNDPDTTTLPFPDLTRVTIVRPSHGATGERRIAVNLLNGTNGIDCAKDVPLEFGDVVEIPERDHSLAESAVGLTISQWDSKANCLKGTVQLAVRDQKVELPITPAGFRSIIGNVISQPDVRKLLSSSSDLSRVKVSRHDAKTGEKHEWILDCSNQPSVNPMPPGYVPPRFDLRLRDGDVVEVPEKP